MTKPAELPVGPAVSSAPALFPGTVTLPGRYGSVERLSAGRHKAALWMAMHGHDAIWTYLAPGPFADQAAFDTYITECEQNKERIVYTVIDDGGRAVGILSLMEIRPAMRVIEVGNIVYSPARASVRTRLCAPAIRCRAWRTRRCRGSFP